MNRYVKTSMMLVITLLFVSSHALARSEAFKENIYDPGMLKPIDSKLKIKVGEKVPDFTLPSLSGDKISLSQFRGNKNVVLSFVPAAWTPVCSDQWPGYNIAEPLFKKNDATLLGITVDNIPTLFAWTKQMGNLWFHVLSDFYPHGQVSDTLGVLRSDGVSERALFIVDKKGVLRYVHVGDINVRPDLKTLVTELEKANEK